jgi:hypothetical protein
MVEEVVRVTDRLSGDHLVRPRRWRAATVSSMVEGELARLSSSAARCQHRHYWLWMVGVIVSLGGKLRCWGGGVQPLRVGGMGPQCAK